MADNASSLHTRPSLLLRVRDAGDAESWATFVEVYGPLVFGHCRRRGLRHEDAEDVTQKVFAQVAQAIRKFEYRPETGRFRDWLGAVVRNDVNRFLRTQQRQAHAGGGDDGGLDSAEAGAADTAWDEEFHTRVLEVALARSRPHFEPDTWRAFEEVWLQHQLPAAVAAELGRPLDWVYVAKSRVLKRVWDEVQDLADDAAVVAR
jgi:RNA polymerase sigma-70 factor (ECF subfamily)